MMGEEGKLDLDIAKELLVISQKTKKMTEKINSYNKDNFTKGLVNPKFLSDVKKIFNRHFSGVKQSDPQAANRRNMPGYLLDNLPRIDGRNQQ